MRVCVLLPTLNEAESIAEMIDRVRKVDASYIIYVVDSGSTDGTADIAKTHGARLITLNVRGKGLAIKKAFQDIDEDIAILLDSDTSYLPEEIPKLIKALEGCDVVVGSRFKGKIEKGAMKSLNRFGNKVLTNTASILHGKPISDICSGYWGFRKDAYKKMDINARHFSLEANFYVETVKKKLKLCEIPITYTQRRGETKLRLSDGLEIGTYIITKRMR
jgi:glycosyltransferase involved in cell wall biosynthesis